MIATILPGSSNFHAVGYNERKVAKGVARMLEIQNFGARQANPGGTGHIPSGIYFPKYPNPKGTVPRCLLLQGT